VVRGSKAAVAVGLLVAALAVSAARPAAAQSQRGPAGEVDLSRLFNSLPAVFERVANKGYTELFRLMQTLELFRFESEIDRFVGKPRELNDTTSYKLNLLPFYIAYPIYPPLVSQMTRLDSVRANRIYTVTPSSVSLVDLRLQPVQTLEQFNGFGRGDEMASQLLTQFSVREISDLTVLLLSQYRFFPQTDEGWQHTKRSIARAAVPIAVGALATGAAFDAARSFTRGRSPTAARTSSFATTVSFATSASTGTRTCAAASRGAWAVSRPPPASPIRSIPPSASRITRWNWPCARAG